MILAGDVGGTNTRLATFELKRGKLALRHRQNFVNANARDFVSIVREFLASLPYSIDSACFGVAGPVQDGKVVLTNLKWTLDEKRLSKSLKIRRVALINDLVAHAEGINALGPTDMVTLHRGTPIKGGNRAIIAPGTGLGEGGLIFDDRTNDYHAFPSEGGHCDFSPKNAREDALLDYMRNRIGRCSWEDVLSGPGLRHIYDFITSPGEFHVDCAHPDHQPTPAEISQAAIDDTCPASQAAVEMLATFYGAEAGNLALKTLATGGVYIGGGIAPHIVKFLRARAVRTAFTTKGPVNIQKLLSSMPMYLITSNDGALLGAGHYATRL